MSYGLLSLLAVGPATGYDLMLMLQILWPAGHSQIYPLLAKLEEQGHVRHELVQQSDKPDKKVYALTDSGKEELRGWIAKPTARAVSKDELTLKTVSIGIVDPAEGLRLFESRKQFYEEKLRELERKAAKVAKEYGDEQDGVPEFPSPGFGAGVLLRRGIAMTRVNIEWCGWVIGLIEQARRRADTPPSSGKTEE